MIRLLIIFVVALVVWQLFRMASRPSVIKGTLEEARTIGIEEAQGHIQSPILLEDYSEARGIPKEDLEAMVEQDELPYYQWRQYTFIENRELIDTNK